MTSDEEQWPPPSRTRRLWAGLLVLGLAGAVAAWLWWPRAYEALDLLDPVEPHAYVTGGRPSPGSEAQRAMFEFALPAFMIALDRGQDPESASAELELAASQAALPPAVLAALRTFAGTCVQARAEGGEELAQALQRAGAALNTSLAGAELGYYLDTQVTMSRDGALRVFFETFVVTRVTPYQLGAHTEHALLIRRLDHTNIALATLGFTRPEASEALIQVDRIEEHLVAHLLPTLKPDAPFRLAGPEVTRSGELTRLEAVAGEAIREELLAVLDPSAALTLGTTMHDRRALFERWQNLASGRDAVFYAPTTYEVDMDSLEPFRWQLDGFSQLREAHRVLGEDAVVRAYLDARDALAQVVERHELQHRFDYREGVFDALPAALAGTLVHLEAGAPLDDRARVVVAELSAYSASIAESEALAKTELLLLGRHVLGLRGGRRNEAQAAGFLLEQLDAALFPEGPIVGRRPVHYAARMERLLQVPGQRLRATLRALWESWFARTLPAARPVAPAQ